MIPIDETQEAADGNDQEPAKPEQSLRRISEQVHAASMAREPYADLKQPPAPPACRGQPIVTTGYSKNFSYGRPAVFGVVIAAALLAVACAGKRPDAAAALRTDSAAWSQAQTVTVAMAEYRFIPSELKFRRGVAYRLRLENSGAELHEFTAPDFLHAVDLRDPAVLAAGQNEVVVTPGSSKDIYFVARQPGTYVLTCADHDWAGMTGSITIE
jgi:uncharacterized cupredoxin-like copper-binding protein